jgi:FkbM family methyltransferase
MPRYPTIVHKLCRKVATLLQFSQQPRIIEHMEVDLVFSRLHSKHHLHVLDIGAHHGEFLHIFASHDHLHSYDVICVEPLASNVEKLKSTLRHLRHVRVTVCPVAISDQEGWKTFYKGSADTLFTCTESWKQSFPSEFARHTEHQVECLKPETLAMRFRVDLQTPFDFLKIDTEGHDYHVLRSLVDAGVTSFAIMFEIGPALEDVQSAVQLLQGRGFSEFYVFGRAGIATLFIGEYEGLNHLVTLRLQGRLDAGNVVAFAGVPSGLIQG